MPARKSLSVKSLRIIARIRSQSCVARRTNRALRVIQCDQTSVLATSIMFHSEGEKCDDRYKGQSSFLLQVRLRHVNHVDCACGVVVARRRWLGILSSARLALETAAHRAVLSRPKKQSVNDQLGIKSAFCSNRMAILSGAGNGSSAP
jgi:hypothetical protein